MSLQAKNEKTQQTWAIKARVGARCVNGSQFYCLLKRFDAREH